MQIRGAQYVVSVKTGKICFILAFVLFVSSRRKLNDNANLYYAGFGEIEAKKMITLARRRFTVNEFTYL